MHHHFLVELQEGHFMNADHPEQVSLGGVDCTCRKDMALARAGLGNIVHMPSHFTPTDGKPGKSAILLQTYLDLIRVTSKGRNEN